MLPLCTQDGNTKARIRDNSTEKSATVVEVLPDGPADAAGIRVGDIIEAVDGVPVVPCVSPGIRMLNLEHIGPVTVAVVRLKVVRHVFEGFYFHPFAARSPLSS